MDDICEELTDNHSKGDGFAERLSSIAYIIINKKNYSGAGSYPDDYSDEKDRLGTQLEGIALLASKFGSDSEGALKVLEEAYSRADSRLIDSNKESDLRKVMGLLERYVETNGVVYPLDIFKRVVGRELFPEASYVPSKNNGSRRPGNNVRRGQIAFEAYEES